jgi:hypothetical protein
VDGVGDLSGDDRALPRAEEAAEAPKCLCEGLGEHRRESQRDAEGFVGGDDEAALEEP